MRLRTFIGLCVILTSLCLISVAGAADTKPNIIFSMGDVIGMWNIGAYHRGLMAGRTLHIDRLGQEGVIFMNYYN